MKNGEKQKVQHLILQITGNLTMVFITAIVKSPSHPAISRETMHAATLTKMNFHFQLLANC